MKKVFSVAICAAMIGWAGNAMAYVFDVGAGSSVSVNNGDPGLIMYATVLNVGGVSFDLSVGDSYTFDFAKIGTNEGWVNDDDKAPKAVTAYVEFDDPSVTPVVGGSTVGWSQGWWIFNDYQQGWNLTWNDPIQVNFGNGGLFSLDLSDLSFEGAFYQGIEGTKCNPSWGIVTATVTYDKAPVPEPTTMLLFGAGLAGLAAVGRRRKN